MFNHRSTDSNFGFFVKDNKRFIIEEHQNQMKVLQYGVWTSDPPDTFDEEDCRWECRTIFVKADGTEQNGKGCSFSNEGINELTNVLVQQGLGDTGIILEGIVNRPDFGTALNKVTGKSSINEVEPETVTEYFNPNDFLGGDFNGSEKH